MRKFAQSLILALTVNSVCGSMNVLFIALDDLRPNIGPYQNVDHGFSLPTMITPNIDRVAAGGLVLDRAYVQQAVCSPSRTSTLTSRRPDTTHVQDLESYFRIVGGNFTTLPQFFRQQQGYTAVSIGKIFHPVGGSNDDKEYSWDAVYHPNGAQGTWPSYNTTWKAVPAEELATWPITDTVNSDRAIEQLELIAEDVLAGEKKFFIGLGYERSHLPFIFPEEFLELYPMDEIVLPENPFVPEGMPNLAWSNFAEIQAYHDFTSESLNVTGLGDLNVTVPDWKTRDIRRAYYASTSYIDHEIGRVLDTLESLGLASSTIVVLWGDHGYQLGEHAEWCKHTNYEIAARIPLILSVPGLTDKGLRSSSMVESVDLFPTIVEAAGFEPLPQCPEESGNVALCTEGASFMSILTDPDNFPGKQAVFWQYPRGSKLHPHLQSCMGYSAFSGRYRYTEWVKVIEVGEWGWTPDWGNNCDHEELYDLDLDRREDANRYMDPSYKDVKKEMQIILRNGWRALQ